MSKTIVTVLAVIAVILLIVALSWGVAAFLAWLLSLCFGFTWTVKVATGAWIVLLTLAALRVRYE